MIDIARKTSQQVKYFYYHKVSSFKKGVEKYGKKSKTRDKVKA